MIRRSVEGAARMNRRVGNGFFRAVRVSTANLNEPSVRPSTRTRPRHAGSTVLLDRN